MDLKVALRAPAHSRQSIQSISSNSVDREKERASFGGNKGQAHAGRVESPIHDNFRTWEKGDSRQGGPSSP